MSQYGIEFGFDIDDGQLDGLSPQEVFVLGYELGTVYTACQKGESYSGVIHASNAGRVLKVCEKFGYIAPRWSWNSDDCSEEWIECVLEKVK